MSDLFNLNRNPEFGLKAEAKPTNSNILMTNTLVEQRQNNDPLMKTTYPIYLYKPPFGYPRNVNVVFLRELAKNPYVFSVIKAITDQAAEAEWDIVPKEGVDLESNLDDLDFDKLGITEDPQKLKDFGFKTLNDARRFIMEFFKNPNSDNESFSQLLRKIIPDILVLDSGVFNKVYNRKSELVQLRVIDGGAILKNPDRHGSLFNRDDVIFDDGYFGLGAGKGFDVQKQAYRAALDQYNSYGYNEQAAYFQFAYGVNYSVPIPYGKKELIYLMENPSTETVYSRSSFLQSAIDITLNLIYSSKASLDLFLNANIPAGIIQLAEASQEDTQAFQNAFYNQQYSGFDEYGFQRKVNGKMPVVGNPNVNFIPLNMKSNETQLLEIQEWFTKILWSCAGVTASEMGFTENSNKATDQSQTKANARKAVKPRLSMIGASLTDQVLPDLPLGDLFEFKFNEFDAEEEKNKWELYEKKITLGVMSAKQVAEKEGIDYEEPQPKEESNNKDNTEQKSMNTDVGGEGLTDTPLVPIETKPMGKYKDFQDCVNQNKDKSNREAYCGHIKQQVEGKTNLKSVYEFDDNIVLTGKTPEQILQQAVQLVEMNKEVESDEEDKEDSNDTLYDEIREEAEDRLEQEEGLAHDEEFKSKNKLGMPKKTATEQVMEDYYKDFDKMVKDVIDRV